MPQMVAMRQSHPPNTDQQVVATGTRYLCVRWQLPNQQMPCNSLKESWDVQFVLRYSEYRPPNNSVHIFLSERAGKWSFFVLGSATHHTSATWCYVPHFKHMKTQKSSKISKPSAKLLWDLLSGSMTPFAPGEPCTQMFHSIEALDSPGAIIHKVAQTGVADLVHVRSSSRNTSQLRWPPAIPKPTANRNI